jgi:plasmid stability protein
MRSTCLHVRNMSKMIQIRNVPDDLHRKLKARSALAGMSLSDYLLNEIRQIAERPSMEEWLARLERLPPVNPDIPPTQALREERDRR